MIDNIPTSIFGTTFKGRAYDITVNGTAFVLTGAIIQMDLKQNIDDANPVKVYSTEDGSLLISTTIANRFSIVAHTIDFPAGKYFYDIKITMPNGVINKYIKGIWKIDLSVTV